MTTVIGCSRLTLFASRRDFGDRLDDLRQLLLLDEGIAERVGDVEVEFGRRAVFAAVWSRPAFPRAGAIARRRTGRTAVRSRTAVSRRRRSRRDRARALILLDIGGDLPQRAEQERACSDRGIGERHVRRGEPADRSNRGPRSA